MNKIKTTYFVMLPSIVIGTLAMIKNNVPISIWIQNGVIWVLGCIVGHIYLNKEGKRVNDFILIVMVIGLLSLSLYSSNTGGVHRWLALGPIQIYTASALLPLAIICLYKLIDKYPLVYPLGLISIILVILLFQPDAGQLTSFALALAPLALKKINQAPIKYISLLILALFITLTWVYIDDLAPVAHVEKILFLVKEMGLIWFVLGILSLILLVIPFFLPNEKNFTSLALGLYFITEILTTFFGNFPMPIMGYGISPIIGYMIAITYVIKQNDASIGLK